MKTARAAYARKNSMSQIGAGIVNASGSQSVVIPETQEESKAEKKTVTTREGRNTVVTTTTTVPRPPTAGRQTAR